MTNYPPLPDPPTPRPLETAEQHGLAVLLFLIREQVACTCSDEQLALALHVAPVASMVSVTGSKADREIDYRIPAADLVAQAKRLIMATQKARQQLAREAGAQVAQAAQDAPRPARIDPGGPSGPSGGSFVPRRPVPSGPSTAPGLPIPKAPRSYADNWHRVPDYAGPQPRTPAPVDIDF